MTRTAAVLAGSTVLAGAALLAAAPADARVAPEEPGATAATATATAGSHLTKAQVEHAEEQAAEVGTAGPAALVVKAQVERAERALRDPQRADPRRPQQPVDTHPDRPVLGARDAPGPAGWRPRRRRRRRLHGVPLPPPRSCRGSNA